MQNSISGGSLKSVVQLYPLMFDKMTETDRLHRSTQTEVRLFRIQPHKLKVEKAYQDRISRFASLVKGAHIVM